MAAIGTLPVVLGTGTHAARPAASAVGKGGLYSCTTHALVYQTDGSSWTTWATLGAASTVATDPIWDAKGDLAGGTGADTAARLAVGSNDTILMADSGQTTGLKWVASQTPTTQAFSDAAAQGSADTYARGDHLHGMPANPAGASGLTLIEQHTASSSATLDFTAFISGTYDDYLIELNNVIPATNNVTFQWRAGTGGGPTYDSGANYDNAAAYVYNSAINIPGSAGAGATAGKIADSVSNNTNYGISGSLKAANPGGSIYKTFVGDIVMQHQSVGIMQIRYGGVYKSATALTALRFMFDSGNIASGIIRIYGVAK